MQPKDVYMIKVIANIICIFMATISSLALGFGDEKYCHTFSESTCKKGDLIIVGSMQVVEYCDFEKNTITVRSGGGYSLIACYYIGKPRQER